MSGPTGIPVRMTRAELEALAGKVLQLSPADRLRLAAGVLEADSTKAEMALSIAKSACTVIETALVLGKLRERR